MCVETYPEGVGGMHVANGTLTGRCAMNSWAAVVAQVMGRFYVCGVDALKWSRMPETCTAGKTALSDDDFITLNRHTGEAVESQTPLVEADLADDFKELMDMCDRSRNSCWFARDGAHVGVPWSRQL